MRATTLLLLTTAAALVASGRLAAQDLHIQLPVDSMEFLLTSAPFEIRNLTGTRFEEDRTDRANLVFADSSSIMAQLAAAPRGGEEFNNVPRYELAAYKLQRLYLGESELVVPPTAMRAFDLDWYRQLDGDAERTFGDARSVVVLLQSWLNFVSDEDVWDEDRFEEDPAYARNWANLNLFTYLIRHSDSNEGNLLVSSMGNNPRVFAVDNGVAFDSEASNRGTRWRNLLVDRFPASTVERLRGLTEEELHEELGVLAQWRIEDEQLVAVAPTANLNARRGVREDGDIVQMGLTRDEIDDIWYRLEVFLSGIDGGSYQVF